MSIIVVETASQKSLDRAAILLAGVNGGVNRAMQSAMRRAAQHLKTTASRKARERYAISAGQLSGAANPKITYTSGDGVTASILYTGRKIPLYKFDGASPTSPTPLSYTVPALTSGGWAMVHPGVAAKGHVLKSTSPSTFGDGFTATMSNGHTGLFRRMSGTNSKIEEIMGLSVPQMVGSDEIKFEVSEQAMDKFEERLDHEVSRLLGG